MAEMTKDLTAAEVEAAVRGLSVAHVTNLGIEVTLPVMFPGGDLINIVVTQDGDGFLVHDGSAAVMFLASIGVRFTADARRKARPLVAKYGCELSGDRVMRRCSREQIAVVSAMVANASRAIGDQAIEVRRRVEHDFREALTERVRSLVGKRARVNEEVVGSSGRAYRVHNVILDSAEKRPIAYIEPVANRSVVNAHFAEFFDLTKSHEGVATISVYNEHSDLRPEDKNLLANVGDVIAFSESQVRLRSFV